MGMLNTQNETTEELGNQEEYFFDQANNSNKKNSVIYALNVPFHFPHSLFHRLEGNLTITAVTIK